MAAALDRPRGPLPQRVAVEQQRDHHRRVMRRPTMTVRAVGTIELGQIDLADHVEHQPRQVTSSIHSRRLGGNNNACSRSHPKKFCGITEVS